MSWEIKGDRPVYTQLLEQIEARIISGEYPLGSKLPSVRELASEASVNPNTMQKALIELEKNELVITQRTAGRFITKDMEKLKMIKEIAAKEHISQFLNNMKRLGLNKADIISLLEKYE